MATEIGVGMVGLGWMGQVHTRGYRRLLDHYPGCALTPRLVIAAEAVEESAGRLGYESWTTNWREVVEHPEVEAVSITAPNYLHREVAVAAALAAIADVDADRAGKIAGKNVPVFREAVEMIRDESVEAVVIASPSATHAELTLECLRLGKPVLCEKPLSTTAEDALEVVEAEVELGRKLVQLCFMRRFDKQHLAVKEAVDSGSIGSPLLFKGWHRNPHIMSSMATSESVVLDSMIHDLDSVRWMFGSEIDEVYTRGMSTRPDLEGAHDLQLTQISVGGEFLATVEVYVTAEYGYEVGLEIVCESGTAHVAPFDEAVVRRDAMQHQRIHTDPFVRFQPAFVAEMERWTGAIRDGEQPDGPDAWDGYAALLAAESCIVSLRSGSPQSVTVPERPALYRGEGLGVVR